jgi:hypothetical protein
MKQQSFFLLVACLVPCLAQSVTLHYDNAPFPAGGRRETSLTEQGFVTTGSFTHSGTQNPNRSSNASTGFLDVINGDQAVVRPVAGGLLDAVSIDLAEYSTVFRFPARVEFFRNTR